MHSFVHTHKIKHTYNQIRNRNNENDDDDDDDDDNIVLKQCLQIPFLTLCLYFVRRYTRVLG